MAEPTKQIKLVWPEHLWLALSRKAMKEHTSLQTVITEAVLTFYGLESWRKLAKEVEDKEVQKILDFYGIDKDMYIIAGEQL